MLGLNLIGPEEALYMEHIFVEADGQLFKHYTGHYTCDSLTEFGKALAEKWIQDPARKANVELIIETEDVTQKPKAEAPSETGTEAEETDPT